MPKNVTSLKVRHLMGLSTAVLFLVPQVFAISKSQNTNSAISTLNSGYKKPSSPYSVTLIDWSQMNVEDSRHLGAYGGIRSYNAIEVQRKLGDGWSMGVRVAGEYLANADNSVEGYSDQQLGQAYGGGVAPGWNLVDPALTFVQKTHLHLLGSENVSNKYWIFVSASNTSKILNRLAYLRQDTETEWTITDSKFVITGELSSRIYVQGVRDQSVKPVVREVGYETEPVYDRNHFDGSYIRLLPYLGTAYNFTKKVNIYGKVGSDSRFRINGNGMYLQTLELEVGTNFPLGPLNFNPNISETASTSGYNDSQLYDYELGIPNQQVFSLIVATKF